MSESSWRICCVNGKNAGHFLLWSNEYNWAAFTGFNKFRGETLNADWLMVNKLRPTTNCSQTILIVSFYDLLGYGGHFLIRSEVSMWAKSELKFPLVNDQFGGHSSGSSPVVCDKPGANMHPSSSELNPQSDCAQHCNRCLYGMVLKMRLLSVHCVSMVTKYPGPSWPEYSFSK